MSDSVDPLTERIATQMKDITHRFYEGQRQIKIAKPSQSDILPTRKAQFLRRIELMEAELGRMQKLLNELRADALHLTTE